MGCSNEIAVEKPTEKKGYPGCLLTVPLEWEITSLVALNFPTLIFVWKNELLSSNYYIKEILVILKKSKEELTV